MRLPLRIYGNVLGLMSTIVPCAGESWQASVQLWHGMRYNAAASSDFRRGQTCRSFSPTAHWAHLTKSSSIGIAVIFVVMMVVSWLRSQALTEDESEDDDRIKNDREHFELQ